MDDRKLIDYIRKYEELYNFSHKDYSNGNTRKKKWVIIAKKLRQPVHVCKTRWGRIRDNFRKSLKKRATRRGQPLKKFKYEDKLDFLLPFLIKTEKKDNRSSTEKITSDENDNNQSDDNDDTKEDDQNRGRISKSKYMNYIKLMKNTGNSNKNNDDDTTISNLSPSSSAFIKKKRIHKAKCKSISAMKYVLEKNERINQQPVHPVDAFFIGLKPTLRSLSPYYLNLAKSQIFNIVQELEMDQIMQQRSATPSSSVQS